VLAGVTILPAFSSDIWARSVPEPVFLSSGAYRHYLQPGKIVWVVDIHPDRQLIWQAETNFFFRLAGGFFGGTPQGVSDAALQERLTAGQIDPTTSIADIRNFLTVHRVSAILAADLPWGVIQKIQRATGHWGYRLMQVRLFRLHGRFTDPAQAGRPIRQLRRDLIAQRRARQLAQKARPSP